MKAMEFDAVPGPDRTIALPPEVAEQIPAGEHVRVMILLGETDDDEQDDADWKRMALEKFFEGEEDFDGLYDEP